MGPAAEAPPLDAGASAVTWVGGAAAGAGPRGKVRRDLAGSLAQVCIPCVCIFLLLLTLFLLVLEREGKGEGERHKSAASAGPCWEWCWKPERVP